MIDNNNDDYANNNRLNHNNQNQNRNHNHNNASVKCGHIAANQDAHSVTSGLQVKFTAFCHCSFARRSRL